MNNDEANYRAFLEGDIAGFENLVLTYKDSLIYFIQRYVKDFDTAEDLAQDAFVDVYLYKERYTFRVSFKTYLYTIGRNKAVDYIRKNRRLVLMGDEESDEIEAEGQSMEDRIVTQETNQTVRRALRKLKPDYQAAIELIDLEEMSYADAAGILRKTLPQMKILIFRARKSLKKQLESEGYVHEN